MNPPDHGFEAGVEAAQENLAEALYTIYQALRASDQARLGDRQELVDNLADRIAEAYGRDEDPLDLADRLLNAVADHLGMEL